MRKAIVLAIAVLSMQAEAAPTFAPATFHAAGQTQEGVAIGDLDGDGDRDLAVLDRTLGLRVLFNNGSGAFPTSATYANLWPDSVTSDIAVADLDRDGDNDLAVTFFTFSGAVSILLNNGDGSFAAPINYETCYSTQAVTIADLNGDHHGDTASASNCFMASILINDGHASFADNGEWGNGYTPSGIAAGDLDGDGDREVAYTNGTSSITLLFNDGSGSFPVTRSVPALDSPEDVKIVDLDGDGDNDLVSSNLYSDDLNVFLNDGTGTLGAVQKFALGDGPEGMAAADLDLDGDLDLVTANRFGNSVSFAVNDGAGRFPSRVDRAAGTGPEDVVVGDLNGDARPDVAASHWGSGSVAVYINTTSAAPDQDADGVTDAGDCAPASRSAWSLPSTVTDLLADGAAPTAFSWSEPERSGTSQPRYDLLRAGTPAGFSAAACLLSASAARNATEASNPASGSAWYYLVRSRNACGTSLGSTSAGVPRIGPTCPSP